MRTIATKSGTHAHAIVLEEVVGGAHRYAVRVVWVAGDRRLQLDGIVGQHVALKIAERFAPSASDVALVPALFGCDPDQISRPAAVGDASAQIPKGPNEVGSEGPDQMDRHALRESQPCSNPSPISSRSAHFFQGISRPGAAADPVARNSDGPSKNRLTLP